MLRAWVLATVLALIRSCQGGGVSRTSSKGSGRESRPLTGGPFRASNSHRSASFSPGQAIASTPAGGAKASSPRKGFTLVASGDILTHSTVYERALINGGGEHYDFDPMFRKVNPLLSAADLAICHLETPLSPNNNNLSGYPRFNAPHQLADAVSNAGYDLCSTASNHAYDFGSPGVKATLSVLDKAGVRHSGTARHVRASQRPELLEVNGIKVGLLSYTYGLNGLLPPDKAWMVDVIDPQTILSEARKARSAGADFVVLSLHWGIEYQVTPSQDQRALGRRLLRSDVIDLILGHHSHVVQPIARVNKEVVVYGMGNLLADQTIACCSVETRDGVIVRVEVTDTGDDLHVKRITYTPTWIQLGSHIITPVARALENPSTPADVRVVLEASWRRTRAAVGSLVRKYDVKPEPPHPRP